ncbi:phosphate ABC transporter substrate-binding protein, PhoT family [Roseovarius mucosus DSM 17069]|uniref:Phosphate ABC transporter substrate-binding protein, PhoT family n=1 Tax=Roseovarius mucosus DSM 17069 TaxID=1288298 RepID=A0A0A0HPM3_9RHOB|nr:phosphate ABC transporter substrate-binding/OmpA family protein [Roseovarius mucosus]KGM89807.1 phosphate ABC transporter substrate-binding protein, PhoT family [Roseovarius mucosus DSM 17069]
MTILRAAIIAALWFLAQPGVALAQDVTLRSHDGAVEISGNLLGFDGEFYRVDTIYGELTVDGSGVACEGPGCPDLEHYVARLVFSGAPTIGRVLMPALIEAFGIRGGYDVTRNEISPQELVFTLHQGDGTLVGEFVFRLTNTDEGFADLLANEADIALTLREARQDEITRAREAGLGNLMAPGQVRVLALDALIPVVAPSNPVQDISLRELAQVLSGEITNWVALGGPDAPIDVHLWDAATGIGQASVDQVLRPDGRDVVANAVRHPDGSAFAEAVARDPFAIGLTTRSEQGDTWELALTGDCGFALSATRRAVKTEDYPLTAPLFIYLPARRLPKLGREFMTYLRDPSAQLVIRRAGFVDQTPEEIEINAQGDRFANAIAQAGVEVGLEELQRMVRVLGPLKRLTTTFRFEAGSIRLDAQSRSNAEQLARAMELGHYDARRLVFVGFSDGDGPAGTNRDIALRRAETVQRAVTRAAETANLERIGLELDAFGEAMPMACDDTAWGRQVNRRVEVWVR